MNHTLSIDALLDATARAIFTVNAAGLIIHASHLARQSLHIEPGENLLEQLPDFWPQVKKTLSGQSPQQALPLHMRQDEYFVDINPLLVDGDIIGVACTLVDSQQLERMTSKLPSFQTLSRELDTIIDSSSDGLFVCDADANVIRVNPASERIHKISARELIGRNMRELVESGFIDRSAALETSLTKKPVSQLQNKDGRKLISISTPVFDEMGELIRIVVSERDITEIDTLQRELEDKEALNDQFRDQMLAMQHAELDAKQIIARSPEMIRALQQAVRVAGADSSVLVLGESGVGKGLIADLIHKNSRRADNPLIKINCGAIPESLIEAELFGYEKGAFTGAQANGKPGHFELADGGTLFLDEIAELPLPSQVKLLRFLEDGRITRLGGTSSKNVDVRVLAATHRDLEQMVKEGRFRLDLYYRLNVIPIQVPAVRERRDCVVPLIRHYIELFSEQVGSKKRLTRAALDTLANYPFPGNVRELMNICERLVVMSETESIDISDLPAQIVERAERLNVNSVEWQEGMSLQDALDRVEKSILEKAQKRFGNQTEIAKALGVNQSTIARKLKRHQLN
ncbi:PAS domain S-box-containing protein [Malonomonas rubra DSM 5091]|uniref:HTH-type transcriptional regulatory protein TyrR n=1 Tax=Malonomonas rubra DSM 5091 TaxID=1122189 RepID=A0A1M6I6B4_MALRU|nr:sigma 54-interacting transcriptional regulator [Malonomonas rubra]SHJ29977.1 PAS domain S-box-containing protein [Malonomonas rubra DSM 5091]